MEPTLEQLLKEKKLVNDNLENVINLFYERGPSNEISGLLRAALAQAYIYNLCCSVPVSLTGGRLRYCIYRMDKTRYAYLACSLSEKLASYPGESRIFLPWRQFFKYVVNDEDCEGLMINNTHRSPQGSIIMMSSPVLQLIMDFAEKTMKDLPDNVRDAVIKGI